MAAPTTCPQSTQVHSLSPGNPCLHVSRAREQGDRWPQVDVQVAEVHTHTPQGQAQPHCDTAHIYVRELLRASFHLFFPTQGGRGAKNKENKQPQRGMEGRHAATTQGF